MRLLILLISFTISLLLTLSCDSATGPEDPPPGRRDYVWEVDTINVPFFSFSDIGGTSPENLWAVGPGGDLGKTIWNFKGDHWETDGISRPISPWSVFGIENTIWIGGGHGFIWKYENDTWQSVTALEKEGYGKVIFSDIWGDKPNNIYAVGSAPESDGIFRQAVVAHYDGNNWELIETPDTKCILYRIRKSPQNNKYYIAGERNEQWVPDTGKIFEFDGKDLKLIYKGVADIDGSADLQLIGNSVLFLIGHRINYYKDGKFTEYIAVDKTNFRQAFQGRNANDIFLNMIDGIAHYNGTNIEYLYRFNNRYTHLLRAVIFEKEIFQIALDTYTGADYIVRGILKE